MQMYSANVLVTHGGGLRRHLEMWCWMLHSCLNKWSCVDRSMVMMERMLKSWVTMDRTVLVIGERKEQEWQCCSVVLLS